MSIARAILLALIAASTACNFDEPSPASPLDDRALPPATAGDAKSKLYNLIGRWYPVSEARRLSDVTLTPEEWCSRLPISINVLPDEVEVRCADGLLQQAAIATVHTTTSSEITLVL